MKIKGLSIGLIFSVLICGFGSTNAEEVLEKKIEAEKKRLYKVTMEDAIKIGLDNSISLKQVKSEIKLSEFNDNRSNYISRQLEKGKSKLEDTEDYLNNIFHGNIPEAYRDELQKGDQKLGAGIGEVNESLNSKLNLAVAGSLTLDNTRSLMTTMSNVSLEVTKASYDIYKNQIAMLIQKSYYDVLKAQKMLSVKQKSVERAKRQFQFAKDSFEQGMKAKDDMLLAGVYHKGTEIELQNAQGTLNTALIELKKNMNVPLDSDILLTDVLAEKVEEFKLEDDLVRGMKNRLEIKKSLGEKIVYDLNFESVKKDFDPITFKYEEAQLLKEKSDISFEKVKAEVEASIRQSYETVKSTGEMLKLTEDMVEQAKESLEIAEYKYKEGFGADSSLLKKLDLEASAGTIVEVLAAEENLSQVEEKVVQIMYGYNLAKMKYFNDTGKFIY